MSFFHAYWMINAAIASSYILANVMLRLPLFNTYSQSQQLKFVRQIFFTTPLIFLLSAFLLEYFPTETDRPFQLQPMLKTASVSFLQHHTNIKLPLNNFQPNASPFIINYLFYTGILLVFLILLTKYIKDRLALKNLTTRAFRKHQINRIHILFSDETTVPFCWSSFRSHFVIIPTLFLTKTADLKLALRHELQHIRQGDTYFLFLLSLLKLIFFWNPFIKWWGNWLNELQELACDENLILGKKISRMHYAQCLINTAAISHSNPFLPEGALGIIGLSKNYHFQLTRRITMLFDYKKSSTKKASLIAAYTACFLAATSIAYALNGNGTHTSISAQKINTVINQHHLNIPMANEVVTEVNNFRQNKSAHTFMRDALQRMKKYQLYIESQLKKNNLPTQLLALPLIESGYDMKALSPMQAAGIWQFIPSTAEHFNLTINNERDDRLNLQLSTQAAITFLKMLYAQFHDWRLAVIAYEIGEDHTEALIKQVGSRDPRAIANAPLAPPTLKKFLAMYDATVIILNDPKLIS